MSIKQPKIIIPVISIIILGSVALYYFNPFSKQPAPISISSARIVIEELPEASPIVLAAGTAWYNEFPSANWPNQDYYLHSQEFLRVRTAEPSSVEGHNRAMIEAELPIDPIIGATLILHGRNSMEPAVELYGYIGNGIIEPDDADSSSQLLETFVPPHQGTIELDVFDFIHEMRISGNTHIGFRLQLLDELSLDPGMSRRSEWGWYPMNIMQQPQPVELQIETCYADCDQSTGPGSLDIFDFLCFQNAFVKRNSYACNCDTSTGPDVCDTFDFLCFQNLFVRGCR